MRGRTARMVTVGIAMGLLASGARAAAERLESFTGVIEEISAASIRVARNGESRVFGHDPSLVRGTRLRVGDRITVWYALEARKVTPARAQEAGEVRDEKPILDDRAFYSAERERKSAPKDRSSGG